MENNDSIRYGERINESYLRQMMARDDRYTKKVYERSRPASSEAESGRCTCRQQEEGTASDERSLAMVYAEKQKFRNIYDTRSAIGHGTIFKDLDLPFLGYKEMR